MPFKKLCPAKLLAFVDLLSPDLNFYLGDLTQPVLLLGKGVGHKCLELRDILYVVILWNAYRIAPIARKNKGTEGFALQLMDFFCYLIEILILPVCQGLFTKNINGN